MEYINKIMELLNIVVENRMEALAVISAIGVGFLMGYIFKATKEADNLIKAKENLTEMIDQLEYKGTVFCQSIQKVGYRIARNVGNQIEEKLEGQLEDKTDKFLAEIEELERTIEELKTRQQEQESDTSSGGKPILEKTPEQEEERKRRSRNFN